MGEGISDSEISINTGNEVWNCLVPVLPSIKVTLGKARGGLQLRGRVPWPGWGPTGSEWGTWPLSCGGGVPRRLSTPGLSPQAWNVSGLRNCLCPYISDFFISLPRFGEKFRRNNNNKNYMVRSNHIAFLFPPNDSGNLPSQEAFFHVSLTPPPHLPPMCSAHSAWIRSHVGCGNQISLRMKERNRWETVLRGHMLYIARLEGWGWGGRDASAILLLYCLKELLQL